MRNYIRTFWARIEWDYDPSPPNPPTHRDIYVFSPSDEELQIQIDLFIEGLASDPANGNVTVPARGPVYWLMDKLNLFYALDQSGVSLKAQGFNIPWLKYPGEDDESTPRHGWKDAAGVKRKPPPSEGGFINPNPANYTGAAGLLAWVELLPAFAKKLLRKGLYQQGGSVLFAYRQIKSGVWSITRAIDYLHRARIV